MHIVMVTAFFTDNSYTPLSGMPRYVYKISDLLQQCGHQVEIVAGSTNNRKWVYKGVKVYNAQWHGTMYGPKKDVAADIFRREFAIQKVLHEIDKKETIDIVQYAGWSGVGFLHSLKCPSVLRLSTYSKVQYNQSEVFKKNVEIYSFWERMSGRRADGVIAPGELLGREFEKDISRKVTIMETPFSNNVKETQSFYEANLKNMEYMMFYGMASKDKGFETIGDMLVKFFAVNSEMNFVFAGWDVKTGDESAVQKLKGKLGKNAERVIYLGIIPQEQLYPVIRHSEFVLVPSLIDNLPNACLEALSLDKIVIGTYNTSLEQMICDGENGFLTFPGDSDSLYEAVIKASSLSEDQKQQMSEKNKIIMKKYAPEVAVKKLENYYNMLIKNRRCRSI